MIYLASLIPLELREVVCYFIWILFAWSYLLLYLFEKVQGNRDNIESSGIIAAPYVLTVILTLGFSIEMYFSIEGKYRILATNEYELKTMVTLGLLVMIYGLWKVLAARIHLNGQWHPHPYLPRKDEVLITKGPYRVIRHPIYFGQLCMMAGSAAVLNSYVAIGALAFLSLAIVSRITREEAHLKRYYSDSFSSYKDNTYIIFRYLL